MIHFQKIKFRNFQACGNIPIEIQLDAYPKTLIVGKNGAGKTTFIDALCFCLYNKSFRGSNKPQYVNTRIGKDLLVEVSFNNGKSDYMVRRGIKPNVFEIWKNGKLLDQNSDIGDYQDILEKHILKMNFKTFCQIDVLGSKDYIPFMKLTAAARREVVEDLFDVQIFSRMNNLLKERANQNKTDLSETQIIIDSLERTISLVEKMRSVAPVDNSLTILAKKQRIGLVEEETKEAVEKQQAIEGLLKVAKEMQNQCLRKKQKRDKANEILVKIDRKKKSLQKIIDFYSGGSCATCKQPIHEDFGTAKIRETEIELAELKKNEDEMNRMIAEKFSEVDEAYDAAVDNVDDLEKQLQEAKTKIRHNQAIIDIIENDIKSLETTIETTEIDQPENALEKTKADLEAALKRKERLLKDREMIVVMGSLLKDGGIKTNVIRQYIPIINSMINKYLEKFDFFVNFEFDENFNETINARYMDSYSYYSFSAGERQRIDMAILFSWRDLAKMRNSASSSLLIMDEILDGSLDHDGTDDFMKTIAVIEDAPNIFIISHKADSYFDRFDKTIRFEKRNTFSVLMESNK